MHGVRIISKLLGKFSLKVLKEYIFAIRWLMKKLYNLEFTTLKWKIIFSVASTTKSGARCQVRKLPQTIILPRIPKNTFMNQCKKTIIFPHIVIITIILSHIPIDIMKWPSWPTINAMLLKAWALDKPQSHSYNFVDDLGPEGHNYCRQPFYYIIFFNYYI